jgi:hypothetical protein
LVVCASDLPLRVWSYADRDIALDAGWAARDAIAQQLLAHRLARSTCDGDCGWRDDGEERGRA